MTHGLVAALFWVLTASNVAADAYWDTHTSSDRRLAQRIVDEVLDELRETEAVFRDRHDYLRLAAALDRAVALAPRFADALYWRAKLRTMVANRSDVREQETAIRAWLALRDAFPLYAPDETAFSLGVAYSSGARFDDAIREYLTAIDHSTDEREDVTTMSNLAEVYMSASRLEEAVTWYDRALLIAREHASADVLSVGLAYFGRAVARDRLGEHAAAIEDAVQALSVGGTLSILRTQGVFYSPECEIHWYEALGHEALASMMSGARRHNETLLALNSWRAYLRLAMHDDAWRPLAEQRLRQTEQRLRELQDSTLPPEPFGVQ